jgi:hypothetical protein
LSPEGFEPDAPWFLMTGFSGDFIVKDIASSVKDVGAGTFVLVAVVFAFSFALLENYSQKFECFFVCLYFCWFLLLDFLLWPLLLCFVLFSF